MIYCEKQRGGLCRLHSLNAYFEKKKISDKDFNNYCNEFDIYINKKFKTKISCKQFDLVNSDQNTIISYILKQNKIYTIFIAINYLNGYLKKRNINIHNLFCSTDFIFVFNQTHIWGVRNVDNKYYSVDSISGVKKINIDNYFNQKNIGIIVPIHKKELIKYEYDYNVRKIKEYIGKEKIEPLLKKMWSEKLLLDELEVYIGLIMNIYEINNDDRYILYEKFNHEYIGKYSLNIALKYIPQILKTIL